MRNKILGFAVLAVASVMVAAGTGAEAQETSRETQRTGGAAVGAEIVHPAAWNVEREPYTYEDTYGYTLWYPDTDAAHDHGGRPALRVALAYSLEPADIEAEVEGVMADHPDLSLRQERVGVAREHEGVAVGTIPGSTPFTAVYVPVNGRVYKINVYADNPARPGLDATSKGLLADVRFEPPTRPVGSLDLPDANSPEALVSSADPGLVADEEAEHRAATDGEEAVLRTSDLRGGGEKEIAEGCYLADPRFWVQTQHGKRANENRAWKNGRAGWTRIGLYNFWGEYTHGNIGYGRCASNDYTNDKFAIDYFLDKGDVVFSPFRTGTVRFAGRRDSHKNYGIFVVIVTEHGGERYVSMSAHLSGLNVRQGAPVDEDKIIGFAGKTGDPTTIPVGDPHLHQAFYRNPSYIDDAPYGGRGLQVVRHHFVGDAAGDPNGGVYTFGRKPTSKKTCRPSIVCGKGYFISN